MPKHIWRRRRNTRTTAQSILDRCATTFARRAHGANGTAYNAMIGMANLLRYHYRQEQDGKIQLAGIRQGPQVPHAGADHI